VSPKLRRIVGSVAPALATALGGPLAGMATAAISKELLGKPDASPEELEQALFTSGPEVLVKLRELDRQFEAEMRKLDIDLAALEVKDRASARRMFSVNVWPQVTLSALFVGGYFAVLYALFDQVRSGALAEVPSWVLGLSTTLLGVLTGEVPRIMAFWFGSSLGSKEKTRVLAASQPVKEGD